MGSDLLYFNKAKEKSNAAMAADTSLLYKSRTGSPCQDTGRIFLNAIIEHSSERKASNHHSPFTAAAQHERGRARRV
jgi:hypothetical protein